jgi:hypothetical protein
MTNGVGAADKKNPPTQPPPAIASTSSMGSAEQQSLQIQKMEDEKADLEENLKTCLNKITSLEEDKKKAQKSQIEEVLSILSSAGKMSSLTEALGDTDISLDLLMQKVLSRFNIELGDPGRGQLIEATGRGQDDRRQGGNVSAKIISRIKKYSGDDEHYTWENFMTQLNFAARDETYSDSELCHVFCQTLEGRALQHYEAHEDQYSQGSYEALIKAFKERFGQPTKLGVSSLVGIHQHDEEDVMTFMDRIINTAKALRPVLPPSHRVLKLPGSQDQVIPNPSYATEKLRYDVIMEQNQKYQVTFFLQGLSTEIKSHMKSSAYENLHDAAKSAKEVEDHLKVTGLTNQLNHLTVKPEKKSKGFQGQTNFVARDNPLRSMDKRGLTIQRSGKFNRNQIICYRCNKSGHYKRDCPLNSGISRRYRDNYGSNYRARSRSYDRPRSFSRSSSFDRSRSRSRSAPRTSHRQIEELTNSLQKMKMEVNTLRRGRSQNRKRNNEAHESRSRSRSFNRNRSGSRSRSFSGSRSNSKNRYRRRDQ